METNNMNQDVIVGEIDAVYFENPRNYYKVVRIEVDQDETSLLIGDNIVITGQFATLQTETTYEFYGHITYHPKYGEQFAVSHYQQRTPTTEDGLIDYLSSNRFKGIGPTLATRIIEKLGLTAIDDIIAKPSVLKGIKGLSDEVADNLRKQLLETQGTEQVFMQLNQWGFGPKISERIYQVYESKAIEIIRNNPYDLIEKVEGIGFNKADDIASQLNFEPLSMERLMAGVYVAVANVTNNNGDTYVLIDQAKKEAQKILEQSRPILVADDILDGAVSRAIDEERIMKLSDGLMLPSVYHAEINIVKQLDQYLKFEQVERFSPDEIEEAINDVITITGIKYDGQQIEALKSSISSPVSVITGGPGTGKTTLIKGLIQLHAILHGYDLDESSKYSNENPILLAAPTGRAAKRMQETTGLPASTIHRLIGYTRETQVDDFYGQELEGSLLIVDEMSMVDTWLMNWLMQSVSYHMQVVFVGDKDQLPSVGPGRVFADLIESEVIPTIRLSTIYRQEEGSSIVELAHTIREGRLPEDFLVKQPDRTFIPAPAGQIVSAVKQIVHFATKKEFNKSNMQVLAPMYKGPAGINALNDMLQSLLNPKQEKKREIQHYDRLFRVGDKVLQLVNDTENGVYNGDTGEIIAIFKKDETESKTDEVIVTFEDDKELTYKFGDLSQLTLAYCTSIHKAQGSEYPLVILPLVDTYSRMLRKDLLYTAVTRAQKSLIMIGNPQSFQLAVSRQQTPRQTFLKDLLQVQFDHESGNEVEVGSPTESEDQLEETDIEEGTVLTMANYTSIDPMIGMKGITPEMLMNENK